MPQIKFKNEQGIYEVPLLMSAHGPQGPVGLTSNLTIGEVITLNHNSQATVSISGTLEQPVLNFGIPRGVPGLEQVYPIGSIYISTVYFNPAEIFGFGEWEQIKDVFLLASGNTYLAGSTGGEAYHTLTINEMPSHNHTILTEFGATASNNLSPANGTYEQVAGPNAVTHYNETTAIVSTGGSQAHNNMPPYLTVYMWVKKN